MEGAQSARLSSEVPTLPCDNLSTGVYWVPAFAGMTDVDGSIQ